LKEKERGEVILHQKGCRHIARRKKERDVASSGAEEGWKGLQKLRAAKKVRGRKGEW